MATANESAFFSNISASTAPFLLNGGRYGIDVVATFGGGSVALEKLGPDGTTYVSLKAAFNNSGTEADLVIGSFAAAGHKVVDIPPGSYRFTIATASAVYAGISRVSGV